MQIDVRPGRARITVGPPGGPTVKLPVACTIKVTDVEPYDLDVKMEWVEHDRRLGVRAATFTSHPGGESVRLASINRIALSGLLHEALESEFLGSAGWTGVVEDHGDHDQVAVDALVYLLAIALDSQKPSATVAIARGLSPASGPKRVSAARKAGLIPETEPGKAAGA